MSSFYCHLYFVNNSFLFQFSTQQPHKRTTPLIQILQGIPDKPDPDPEPEPRKEKGKGSTRKNLSKIFSRKKLKKKSKYKSRIFIKKRKKKIAGR